MASLRPRLRRSKLIGLVCLGILAVASGGFVIAYQMGLRAASPTTNVVTFTISSGENAQVIAERLYAARLIRSRNVFVTYVNLHGLRAQLKTGVYQLSAHQSTATIAQTIAGGRTLSKRMVVPEGYTLTQIIDAAATLGVSKADMQQALSASYTQSFLSSKPVGVTLEGYLFPDSYEVSSGTSATQLVNVMLQNFGSKVGSTYTAAFAAQGLTLHQGLTLASIVEREVNIAADRPVVAQIFLKRFRTGQSLGSDVTSIYAAQLLGVPFSVDVNSPYNTRRFVGLPPGPICSPGLSAMDAVARPAGTDYTYFLSGNDGKTYYAKTYTEHQQNIVKYLN